MSKILIEIARWLGSKILILSVIIAVLLLASWVMMEFSQLRERIVEASAMERVLHNLDEQLGTLQERRSLLESQLSELVGELEGLEAIRTTAKEAEVESMESLSRIQGEKRWYYTKITHPEYFLRLAAAERSHAVARRAANAADTAFRKVQADMERSPAGQELVQLNDQITNQTEEIDALREAVASARAATDAHPLERLRHQVVRVLPTALGILAVVILLPVLVKAALYFLLAPLISRARPVRLLPETRGEAEVSASSVSLSLELQPGDELIVHSDYLQAAGTGPGKKTRFLFSWRMPLTSLAAGLFMLVTVRNSLESACNVTISPKSDLFDKICRVRLPEGSSMVIYPRSLVGVIVNGGTPPRITRHWRIFNLHSWITFQFRYLVIHGASEFFIKGCRGVRAGRIESGESRMQDQCATIGFTANLEYSGIRCETFIDYLRGKDGLFNDRFANAPGFHFTEEIPDPRRKTGLFGRGIEGVIDGFLKGFGI